MEREREVLDALQRTWGYSDLRPLQGEAIDAALEGRDAMVVMPTGGGKSICYQLPPLVDGGLTLVVSPLISLMKDQVDALRMVGYPAAALHSGLGSAEAQEVTEGLKQGSIRLIYLSPERVLTPATVAMLRGAAQGGGVKRIAVDEAHCISQWGHDFRPEYRQLARLREVFPHAPIHALTATATPRVRLDVARQLGLRRARLLVGVFDRPNLTYRVVPKVDAVSQTAEAIRRHPGEASIVYCLSRKDTERTADALTGLGIQARAYHAGLGPAERSRVSEDFAMERLDVVVATVAFGMGIDRANVRCVVHLSVPKSIEGYQQETGRAGRDGEPSECLMLYDPSDVIAMARLLRDSASGEHLAHQLELLDEVRRFANSQDCRHRFLSSYFGQDYPEQPCEACDLCLEGWQEVPNSTKVAHQILAAVRELDAKHGDFGFGSAHIADILTGSRKEALRKFGHEKLRAYGCLSGPSAKQVAQWVLQLGDQGLLMRSGANFPTLHLSPEGAAALREQSPIRLRDLPVKTARRRESVLPEGVSAALFEALRQLRRSIAEEREVPAYVIFHDATLVQMAARRPTTLSGFAAIPGIGERRAQDLGPRFIELIARLSASEGIDTDQTGVNATVPPPPVNDTYRRLAPLFASAQTVEEICLSTGLSRGTVCGYLADWVVRERPESIRPWVCEADELRVLAAIERLGPAPLRPIYEAVAEEVTYDQIRLVAAAWQSRSPAGAL